MVVAPSIDKPVTEEVLRAAYIADLKSEFRKLQQTFKWFHDEYDRLPYDLYELAEQNYLEEYEISRMNVNETNYHGAGRRIENTSSFVLLEASISETGDKMVLLSSGEIQVLDQSDFEQLDRSDKKQENSE